MQAMHVLISSARPCAAFATNSGSARNGRAMETMSAAPPLSTDSATSGVLMRLVATKGTFTSPISCFVTLCVTAHGHSGVVRREGGRAAVSSNGCGSDVRGLALPGKASARHHSGNGGNSGLVPPDACVDDGGTSLLDGTRKLHNLVPVGALRHQVQHGESVHNDEVIPTSGAVATIGGRGVGERST